MFRTTIFRMQQKKRIERSRYWKYRHEGKPVIPYKRKKQLIMCEIRRSM